MRNVLTRFAPAVVIAALALPAAAMENTVDPQAIRDAIEERWGGIAVPGATLEVRAVPSLPYDGSAPVLEVLIPGDGKPGPRAVPIACRVDGRVVSRGLANVVIRVERSVWTARRELRRGDPVAAADVLQETRVFDREPVRRFSWTPERRWRAARDVAPGEMLTAADVAAVPDVEAGREIHLVARAGSSTVSVPGRARQDGDVGDVILVHNPVTGALVRAVVLDEGSAELIPAGGGKGEGR